MRIIDLLRIRNKTHSIFCWKRYTVSWIFLLIKEKRKERIGTVVYTHAHAMRAYTTLHTYIHTYTERESVCAKEESERDRERKKKSKWNWSSQCIIVAALSFVCRSVNNLSVPKKKKWIKRWIIEQKWILHNFCLKNLYTVSHKNLNLISDNDNKFHLKWNLVNKLCY